MAKSKDKTPAVPASAATWSDVWFSATDGLKLHARDYGRHSLAARGRLPIVCLPGLTRNARDFHDFAVLMASDPTSPRRVVTFDYRGRGGSDWDKDPTRYTILIEADDVLAGMAALDLPHAAFVGTSRGGLIMHVLAAMRPTVMAAGILNDIGPVIEGAGLAQIKAYLARMPRPASWDEAARILKEAHGKSFPVLRDADWAEMAQAIYVEKDGKITSDYDPALLDSLKDIDLNTPLPTLWPQFEGLRNMPLMTLRGEHSALLSEQTVAEMKARAPAMQAITVKGHGHAPILHLSGLPQIIGSFLRAADKRHGR